MKKPVCSTLLCFWASTSVLSFQTFEVEAQTSIEACLVAPELACMDTLNQQLVMLEQAIGDPYVRAWAQLQHAGTLAAGGQLDAAEQVLNRIRDPEGHPDIRDTAFLEVITELDAESLHRGLRLLNEIADDEIYGQARAYHISHVVRYGSVDRALADLAATDRTGAPLQFVGLDWLAVALAEDGQTDLAMRLVDENIPVDLGRRGSLLSRMAARQIAAGLFDQAQVVIDGIEDAKWRVIASAHMGEALTMSGDFTGGEAAFAAARRELAGMPDPDQRYYVFEIFVRTALSIDRLDLALAVIPDVSSYQFDRVDALNSIAQIALDIGAEVDVRALFHTALAELEDAPRTGEAIEARFHRSLSFLAQSMAIAGDTDWALQTLAQVRTAAWRELDLHSISQNLIEARQFEGALNVLAAQTDWDLHAQGLIRLARAADDTGQAAIADIARVTVIGLAEGLEQVPLTDFTISQLSELDSSRGHFARAESRLRYLNDAHLQRLGRITNLGFAAQLGTDAEFATYLTIAQDAVAQVDNLDIRVSLIRSIMLQLLYADRINQAFRMALDSPDSDIRDALLESLATGLSGSASTHLATAMDAAEAISDPDLRHRHIRLVLMATLRESI